MTNRDKYLKDNIDVEKFIDELHYFWWANEYDVKEGIRQFLNAKAKLPISSDEKVLLKNLRYDEKIIGRNDKGNLYFTNGYKDNRARYFKYYNHLFRFIENGEQYSIQELLNNDFVEVNKTKESKGVEKQ